MDAAVSAGAKEPGQLLLGSGMGTRVRPPDYAAACPVPGNLRALRAVIGDVVRAHGARAAHYQMDTRNAIAAHVVVASVPMLVLSASWPLGLGYAAVRAGEASRSRRCLPVAGVG